MPISPHLGCAFVHIPKTAGTSIETALGMFGSWKQENRGTMFGLIQSEDLSAYGFLTTFLQHLSITELRQLVPSSNRLYSFSFVRNPWDRMVSTYTNTDPHLCRHARAGGIELQHLEFGEFVRRCEDIEHIHLQDQHRFLCDEDGRLAVDFVGRFENLQTDFRTVCERLGIQADLPHRNVSQRRPYRSYYDAATRNLIAHRYRRDIERFAYTF